MIMIMISVSLLNTYVMIMTLDSPTHVRPAPAPGPDAARLSPPRQRPEPSGTTGRLPILMQPEPACLASCRPACR